MPGALSASLFEIAPNIHPTPALRCCLIRPDLGGHWNEIANYRTRLKTVYSNGPVVVSIVLSGMSNHSLFGQLRKYHTIMGPTASAVDLPFARTKLAT